MSRQAKLVLAVLGGAMLIAVLMIVLRPQPEEKPRDERAPLVLTIPLKVSAGPLEVLGSGTVQPREEVTVGAEVAGRLVYVNPGFREGAMIASGTILFRIDPADYKNRVRTAQADVAAQEVAVLQAGEEVAIASQELRRFADRQDRRAKLAPTIDDNDYASRILPPRELEDEASANLAVKDRAQGPNRLATREPQLQSARAARERAAAQLADARLALKRTSVRAPFTGMVRSENAARGKLVQPGQELGSIVAADSFEVRVSLTEGEAALIPGLLGSRRARIPAKVFFDYGGLAYRWSAYVDRADAILDPETRTIDVFLRVPEPLRGGVRVEGDSTTSPPPLLIGSFVRASMTGASLETHARIPAQYLRPGNEIWVVREGKLRILPVRVIQRTDEVAYVVTPSLAKGGQLVTSPLRAPVDGMAVRVEKPRTKRAAPAKARADD
jgi:RND family efflux transporter MFP subunit